jgi:hypothetical protein
LRVQWPQSFNKSSILWRKFQKFVFYSLRFFEPASQSVPYTWLCGYLKNCICSKRTKQNNDNPLTFSVDP